MTSRNRKGQFTKGQSGNPRGRPPGKAKQWQSIEKLLLEPIPIRRTDGTFENMNRFEVAFMNQCKQALNGNKHALFNALEIMLQITPPDKAEETLTMPAEPDFHDLPPVAQLIKVLVDNSDKLPPHMSPASAFAEILHCRDETLVDL